MATQLTGIGNKKKPADAAPVAVAKDLLAHRPEVAAVGLIAFAVAYAGARLVSVGSLVAAFAVIVALLVVGPIDVTSPAHR